MRSEHVLCPDEPPQSPSETSASTNEGGEQRTDADLAVLLRSGSRAAVAAVYDRFSVQVNRWVWRLLGADPDLNDIVQQVFVRILRAGTRLREADKLAAWVHTITVNTVHDELRRRQVRRFFFLDRSRVELHGDFVHEVEVRDMLLRAKSVIEKLPPAERIAFMLHYVERQSASEIAALCGCSVSTAKRRLGRATRRYEAIVAASPELSRVLPQLARDES